MRPSLIRTLGVVIALQFGQTFAAVPPVGLAAGSDYSLFILSDGSLWGQGDNGSGQLGLGSKPQIEYPLKVVGAGVSAVTTRTEHTLFLESDGSLWAMGANESGECGNGGTSDVHLPIKIVSSGVTKTATGVFHSLFVKSDGSLWGMGNNSLGEVGTNLSSILTPVQIISNSVTAAAAGYEFSIFLKSDGSLWAMGDDFYGQLGDGTNTESYVPEQIVAGNVTAIAAGEEFTLFLKSDGSLWGMGSDAYGQLGTGQNPGSYVPILIIPSGVTAIAAGTAHSLFIKSDGSLWGMGANFHGELGIPPTGDGNIYFPTQLVPSGVTAIAGGDIHSLFTTSNGGVWVMGNYTTFFDTYYLPWQIAAGGFVPSLTGLSLNGTNIGVTGNTGWLPAAGEVFYVLSSTNVAQPLAQWKKLATNTFNSSGNFSIVVTNAVSPVDARRFYTLQFP